VSCRRDLSPVWVVVPAFEESAVVAATLDGLRQHFDRIVVIDDCSRDETAAIARARGAHVLRHPVNLGQGASLQTGIEYVLAQGAGSIVTFDADGQHDPADAAAMLGHLALGEFDVVLASRNLGRTEGMPRVRAAMLRLAVAYTRWSTGLRVSDTHNGLRVFSRAAASKLHLRQNRMAHASEILDYIARSKLRYVEYGCTLRYTQYSRSKGQSSMAAFRILFDIAVRKFQR